MHFWQAVDPRRGGFELSCNAQEQVFAPRRRNQLDADGQRIGGPV